MNNQRTRFWTLDLVAGLTGVAVSLAPSFTGQYAIAIICAAVMCIAKVRAS